MIQKPKGTQDVYGNYGKNLLYIEQILQALMEKYNYEYFRTPIFESSELFHRGVGETTDIVSKETYDFVDRGKRNLTLRPEGTAGIVRSFIENKLYSRADLPVKAWYFGPMYRYERPQSGRYREFNQFGIEVFGSSDPIMDAEIISIIVNFYKLLGLKGIKVNINSLGDKISRDNYHQAITEYFKPHIANMCVDCQNRFEKNPLRILDCKIDHNLDVMKKAPKMIDYLTPESKEHFEKVKRYLTALNIEYDVDPNLVRGLDYYTNTVFEIEADIKGFGNQNVLCGGGRYDNLVVNLGGPQTPGVGVAIGIERLMQALELEGIDLGSEGNIDTYIIPLSDMEKEYCLSLVQEIRMNGFKADMDYLNRNLKSNFKQADRLNSKFIIIIGETEINNDILTIKNNQTKEEYKIKREEIIEFLDGNIGDYHD